MLKTTLLNKKDIMFCEKLQEEYDEFIKKTEQYIDFVEEQFPSYDYREENQENRFFDYKFNKNRLIENATRKLMILNEWFIEKVVYYIHDQYKVKIDKSSINKSLCVEQDVDNFKIKKISYEDIIDEIIQQLDGANFQEKAAEDLKEEFLNKISRGHTSNKYKVKGKTVSLWDFMWYDDNYKGELEISHFKGFNELNLLLKVISYVTMGKVENSFLHFSQQLLIATEDIIFGEKHNLYSCGSKLKFYKNRRVDIEFSKTAEVKKFVEEFLPKKNNN
ncbi:MAG: hypothetical protein ACOCQR_02190 [bacterium]